jgi:hypothetical protein
VTPPGALQADAGAETIFGERFALEEAEGQRYDPRRRPSAGGQAPLTGFAAIQVWLISGVKKGGIHGRRAASAAPRDRELLD